MEWNEVRGASVVKPNLLRGGGCRDTQHSSRPGPQNIYVCMCVRVCMEVRGYAWRKAKLGNIYNQKTKEVTRRERR